MTVGVIAIPNLYYPALGKGAFPGTQRYAR